MGSFHSLTTWLTGTVLVVILIVVGIVLASRSSRQDHKGALATIGICLLGLFVIGVAVAGKAPVMATWLANLVTS